MPDTPSPLNALMIVMIAATLLSSARRDLEIKRSSEFGDNRFSDLRVCRTLRLRRPTSASTSGPNCSSLRAPMPGIATSAASSAGSSLGDRDQRVVGEHHVGGHLHLLGGAQPPVLELERAVRSSMSAGQLSQRRSMTAAGRGQRVVADAAPRCRAARLFAACSGSVGPSVRGDAVEEARRLAALPAAGIARQRPAERQMHSRPGDSDVKQAAFLFDRLHCRGRAPARARSAACRRPRRPGRPRPTPGPSRRAATPA